MCLFPPIFREAYRWFCIRLRENGVNVLGVGDASYDELHPDLKRALTEYYRVDSLENYDQVLRAVGYYTGQYGKIDWVESNNEYWLELDAALRTDFNITTGLKSDEIEKYKSKMRMKAYYRQAGIPCARFAPVTDREAGTGLCPGGGISHHCQARQRRGGHCHLEAEMRRGSGGVFPGRSAGTLSHGGICSRRGNDV